MPRMSGFQPLFGLFLYFLVAAWSGNVVAAQPVTPPGSRIALTPPAGFTVSQSFQGFENRQLGAAINMMEFPAGAFDQTRRGMTPDALARRGLRALRTRPLPIAGIDSFLVRVEQQANNTLLDKWLFVFDAKTFTGMVVVTIPRAASGRISEPAIRASLASIRADTAATRDPRALLPYEFDSGKRFRYENVMGGHAVLLKESPPPPKGRTDDAALLITYKRQAIPWIQQDSFGQRALSSFKAMRVKTILNRKPVTVGSLRGYEYRAAAEDPKTGNPLSVVMVVLYSTDSYYILMGFGVPQAVKTAMADIQAVFASFRVKS